MRPAGRMRVGFFPLPEAEARRVHSFLQFPNHHCPALDPCIGDRTLERKLKRRKNGRKLCPICLKEKHGRLR
jgi:hypothetical protein